MWHSSVGHIIGDEGSKDDRCSGYWCLVFSKFGWECQKESLFSELANIDNVLAVKIDGATKEDYVWGLRVGFITYATKNENKDVYEALEDKTAGVIRGSISNASNLSQTLVLKGITSRNYKEEKQEKYNTLKERYDTVKAILKDEKYKTCFESLPFNSGYFMCIKLVEGLDPEEIRKILLKDYSTGVIAIKDMIRIAYSAIPKEDIPRVFDNIYKACKKYLGVE